MTPRDEPPSNPYDPNWPKPEQPPGEPHTQPYGQDPNAQHPYAPYGQQQPYGQAPDAQQAYPPQGQVPYGAPSYGAPSYGTPAYGAPGAAPHPSALSALIFGLVSLAGILMCGGITLPLAPFAWFMGGRAVKEIDANPGRYTGRDQAQAGRIMGMIGTGLLMLGVLALVAFVLFAVSGTGTGTDTDPSSDYSSDSTF